MSLGLIPTWQFSADPRINPNLNAFVPSSAAWKRASSLEGFGYVMVEPSRSTLGPATLEQIRAANDAQTLDGVADWFRTGSWIYNHRTLLLGAGLGLGALAVALIVL